MNARFAERTDCFAHKQSGTCNALKDMVCAKNATCPFYKSKEQQEKELLKYNGTTNMVSIAKEYESGIYK